MITAALSNFAFVITSLADDVASTGIDPTETGFSKVQIASLFIGVFIPILVALVTKARTSSTVKSLLHLALAALSGFLTEMINSANFHWQDALLTTLVTFVIGVATLYGVWYPTGVDAKLKAVGDTTGEGGAISTRTLAWLGVIGLAIILLVIIF